MPECYLRNNLSKIIHLVITVYNMDSKRTGYSEHLFGLRLGLLKCNPGVNGLPDYNRKIINSVVALSTTSSKVLIIRALPLF